VRPVAVILVATITVGAALRLLRRGQRGCCWPKSSWGWAARAYWSPP
jgi:hypothetical protein